MRCYNMGDLNAEINSQLSQVGDCRTAVAGPTATVNARINDDPFTIANMDDY